MPHPAPPAIAPQTTPQNVPGQPRRARPELALPAGSGELAVGPWHAAFYTVLTGRVRSKSNFRAGSGDWGKVQDFEDEVALALRQARPGSWIPVDFTQPAAERPAVVATLVARTMLDAGNLSKSILDAGEGVLYADDAQVASVLDAVERTTRQQGVLMAFAQLPAGATTLEALACQAALTHRITALLEIPF